MDEIAREFEKKAIGESTEGFVVVPLGMVNLRVLDRQNGVWRSDSAGVCGCSLLPSPDHPL